MEKRYSIKTGMVAAATRSAIMARKRGETVARVQAVSAGVPSALVSPSAAESGDWLPRSEFDAMFERWETGRTIVNDEGDEVNEWVIRMKVSAFSEGGLSALGYGGPDGGSAGGDGLDEASLAAYLTAHGYATQTWVTERIAGLGTGGGGVDLSDYATRDWVLACGFLTAHQDLSGYALKSELPSLTGYATRDWVLACGFLTAHQDLSRYALKSELPSLTGYATEQWAEELFLKRRNEAGGCVASWADGLTVTCYSPVKGGLWDSNMLLDLRTSGAGLGAGMKITADGRGMGMYCGEDGDVHWFTVNGREMTRTHWLDQCAGEMVWSIGVKFNGGATVPGNQTLKIGGATLRWDAEHGALCVDGTLYTTGGLSALGFDAADGKPLEMAGSLIPSLSGMYDLGTPTKRWRGLTVKDITADAGFVADMRVNSIRVEETLTANYQEVEELSVGSMMSFGGRQVTVDSSGFLKLA